MLKRMSTGGREDNYEHVLMCLICRSLFDDYDHQPKFLPCHHTFCKDCLREYVRQFGDEIECPSCRKVANIPTAGVTALQTNFYVKYIQSLVSGGGSGAAMGDNHCSRHVSEKLHYFCRQCELSICKQCSKQAECQQHPKIPLTQATEESHQSLDKAFSAANSTIETKKVKLDKTLKALADEKDQALLNIDSAFDQHTHTIQRRATLLKNKVIAIYNEHKDKLENDLEEISTALTCIVSIKDYHEEMISQAVFKDIPKGLEELEEVNRNISERIHPAENHIVFETNHGVERFKGSLRDLGRVRCSRPIAPRADPEGNAGEEEDGAGGVGAGAPGETPDTTPCTESKPFSATPLQSPLEALQSPPDGGAYAVLPPDVTADVTLKHVTNNVTVDDVKPPVEARDTVKPPTKPPPSEGKTAPDVAKSASPRKAPQDAVKPKGKTTAVQHKTTSAPHKTTSAPHKTTGHVTQPPGAKHQEAELDANSNCTSHVDDDVTDAKHAADVAKANSIARLDLGRFSRGPSRKTDKQNANVPLSGGTSKIPTTKPTGIPSPVEGSHKSVGKAPGPGGIPAKPQPPAPLGKMGKHVVAMRHAHAHRERNRKAMETSSGAGGGGGSSSIIAQAIAATSQDRQATGAAAARPDSLLPGPVVPAQRPDSLLKPAAPPAPHAVGPGGGAAPAMPDLLPESVLKVMQSGTDDEKLRAEKEYYHLLYTSYDEEELLRELKSGGVAPPGLEASGGAEPPWGRARTSLDSDNSWLTTSSNSEGSEGNNNEDSEVLVTPTQASV